MVINFGEDKYEVTCVGSHKKKVNTPVTHMGIAALEDF